MKLYFESKDLNYYFHNKDWKKQFKSSVQYFHGISSSLTWCHSARLIGWYTNELLISLRIWLHPHLTNWLSLYPSSGFSEKLSLRSVKNTKPLFFRGSCTTSPLWGRILLIFPGTTTSFLISQPELKNRRSKYPSFCFTFNVSFAFRRTFHDVRKTSTWHHGQRKLKEA